ncbi:hypothetical protein LTR78_010196 [Recurvomyces mirabilis]|uniref:High-affinity methionine permease n=1 Tax=Recurvomyces mirabilis TaxID=574656 RepID=A0AAE0TM28_9PEZI|nr:hypothetical protein LTR78_010196 [Recurvomyces mirabilis]KAK5149725.1 hypothetical protein LTS14_010723 [Recurvomyces mirabilis]
MLASVAYFAAIPKADIRAGKTIAAGLLFTRVFGGHKAVRGLNFLIALSSFGNLVAVFLGTSRLIPPRAGDAFNFTTDLQVYPSSIPNLLMTIDIFVVRSNHKRLGLPEPQFKAWLPVLVFSVFVKLYLIIMPWYPPAKGKYGGDVSFWYGTYIVTSIGILILCGIYYLIYIEVLPRIGRYRMRYELVTLGSGAEAHTPVKVPLNELDEWDGRHDATGANLRDFGSETEKVADETFEKTKQ